MRNSLMARQIGRPFSAFLIFGLMVAAFNPATSANGNDSSAAIVGRSMQVPLLEGLFALHYPVTTKSKEAQDYFNQALVLTFGFDHADAEISFLEAARYDPECAMAYWGVAFILGPNINATMKAADVPRAYTMIQKAMALRDKVTDKERQLIEALAVRYAPEPVADRSPLDAAFAEAMAKVYRNYPDDPNVAVLFAESLMDLNPWNYWAEDGSPQPWEPLIETVLKKVTIEHPEHPHGHHLLIHLLENSPRPEETVKSADIIRRLAPASGHLVHMAGHAYYAAGLYHDCSSINEEAIGVDKRLRVSFRGNGLYQAAYMPHNVHFLLASYMMEGRSQEAITAARILAGGIDPQQMRESGMGALQLYYLSPFYVLVRFGKWDDILAEPAPAEDLKFPMGIWHYARGYAFVRKGEVDRAAGELAMLTSLAADPEVARVTIWDLNRAATLLGIAREVLAAEIAAARKDIVGALAHFKQGIALQDNLIFDEPPPWYYPVRQSLGALLLDLNRIGEAEEVFRRDLRENAENPWSLFGLAKCLRIKGGSGLIADTEKRFRRAWARADLELQRPVF